MSEQDSGLHCESVQQFWLHDSYGWNDDAISREVASEHLTICKTCEAAIEAARALQSSVGQWSETNKAEAAAIKGADQRLERHLIELVREDVERRFVATSLRARFRARAASISASWRELSRTSPAFRALTAAALLLALLLVGFLAIDLSGRSADLGAQEGLLPAIEEAPQKQYCNGPFGDRDLRRGLHRLPEARRDMSTLPRKK